MPRPRVSESAPRPKAAARASAAPPGATFFASPAHLRAWLERHHEQASELCVGLYHKGSGKPSITWPELVDEALCFGWIDGVRHSLGPDSYTVRITPRRAASVWSAVNLRRAEALREAGAMRPAGLRAFEQRTDERTAIYAHEQRHTAALLPAEEQQLRDNARAWAYFEAQPPWYRRGAAHWVTSAKRDDTRRRRLATLIEDSAAGRAIAPLARKAPPAARAGQGAAVNPRRGPRRRSPGATTTRRG